MAGMALMDEITTVPMAGIEVFGTREKQVKVRISYTGMVEVAGMADTLRERSPLKTSESHAE